MLRYSSGMTRSHFDMTKYCFDMLRHNFLIRYSSFFHSLQAVESELKKINARVPFNLKKPTCMSAHIRRRNLIFSLDERFIIKTIEIPWTLCELSSFPILNRSWCVEFPSQIHADNELQDLQWNQFRK